MKLYNNLPITPFLYCAEDAYYLYQKMLYQITEITIERGLICFGAEKILTKQEKKEWYAAERLDRKTFNKLYTCAINDIFNADFIVAMPDFVWEKVSHELRALPTGPRKRIARVFLYIYYWAMRFQGSYSRPREMMVKELRIQKDNLAESLAWLEGKGFMVRSDYSKQEGYARRYYIPEALWTTQCKKEWQELQKSLKN